MKGFLEKAVKPMYRVVWLGMLVWVVGMLWMVTAPGCNDLPKDNEYTSSIEWMESKKEPPHILEILEKFDTQLESMSIEFVDEIDITEDAHITESENSIEEHIDDGSESSDSMDNSEQETPPITMTFSPQARSTISGDAFSTAACPITVEFSQSPNRTSSRAWFRRQGEDVDLIAEIRFEKKTTATICPYQPLKPLTDYTLIVDAAANTTDGSEKRYQQTISYRTNDTYAQGQTPALGLVSSVIMNAVIVPEGLKNAHTLLSKERWPTLIVQLAQRDSANQGILSFFGNRGTFEGGGIPPKGKYKMDNSYLPVGFLMKGTFHGRWFSIGVDELYFPVVPNFVIQLKQIRIIGIFDATGTKIEKARMSAWVEEDWFKTHLSTGSPCLSMFKDHCFRNKDGKMGAVSVAEIAMEPNQWPYSVLIGSPTYLSQAAPLTPQISAFTTGISDATKFNTALSLCTQSKYLDRPCADATQTPVAVSASPVWATDKQHFTLQLPALQPKNWYRLQINTTSAKGEAASNYTVFQTMP